MVAFEKRKENTSEKGRYDFFFSLAETRLIRLDALLIA